MWNRTGRVVAVGAAAVVVLAAASLVPSAAWGAEPPLPASPHPARQLPNGLLPAWPQLADHLVVDGTAGGPLHGTLVVVNRGDRPIDLTTRCRPKYGVVLGNATYSPHVVFPATCDTRPLVIPPGTTRLEVRISTTYLMCTRSAPTPSMPPCNGSGPPPLPAGRYRTVLQGSGLALPQPRSVVVSGPR